MAPVPQSALPSRLIFTLGLAGFASAFTMRAVDPMVPVLAEAFGHSITTTALLSTAYSLMYAVGQPILGPLGDSLGKARMITINTAVLALVLCASAFAPDFETLFLARVFTGFVAGGIIPLGIAALGDRVEFALRPVAIGRFISAVILGQMLGGATSGAIAEHFGWRIVFASAGIVAAVAAALVLKMMKPRQVARSWPKLAALAVSYRSLLSDRRAVTLFAIVAVESMSVYGGFPYLADYLNQRAGNGPTEAGFLIGAYGVGGIIFGAIVSYLIRWLKPQQLMRVGGWSMAAVLVVLALPKPWYFDILTMIVFGCAFYCMHNVFQTQSTELAPKERGLAVSIFACSFFIGNATGPVLFGVVHTLIGYPATYSLCGAVLFLLTLIAPRVLPKDCARQRPR